MFNVNIISPLPERFPGNSGNTIPCNLFKQKHTEDIETDNYPNMYAILHPASNIPDKEISTSISLVKGHLCRQLKLIFQQLMYSPTSKHTNIVNGSCIALCGDFPEYLADFWRKIRPRHLLVTEILFYEGRSVTHWLRDLNEGGGAYNNNSKQLSQEKVIM